MNGLSGAPSRTNNIVFLLACICTAVPIWVTTYPPLVDIPQHAAQISLIKNYLSDDFHFRSLFNFNAFSAYWGGYALTLFWTLWFDIVTAIKLSLTISLIATPLSCAFFRRQAQAPTEFDWLFLPIVYGFAYQWGFLNFLIALPVGITLLGISLKHKRMPSQRSNTLLLLWVTALFLCHVLATAVFCILSALLLYKKEDHLPSWLKRIAPLLISIPLGIAWLFATSSESQFNASGPWGLGTHRLSAFFPQLLGLSASWSNNILSIAICVIPFLLGYRISKDASRTLPFAFYTLFMLFGPNYFLGNFFTYNRFDILGLPLYALCFTNERHKHLIIPIHSNIATISLAITLIVATTLKTLQFDKESKSFSSLITQIPKEQRILGLIFEPYSPLYNTPTYLHFPSWYQAQRNGIADFSFSNFYPQIVRYKKEFLPAATPNFVWQPHTFNWEDHKKDNYDYIISRAYIDTQRFVQQSTEITHIKSVAPWQLYLVTRQ